MSINDPIKKAGPKATCLAAKKKPKDNTVFIDDWVLQKCLSYCNVRRGSLTAKDVIRWWKHEAIKNPKTIQRKKDILLRCIKKVPI